jgi:hypothetical protein
LARATGRGLLHPGDERVHFTLRSRVTGKSAYAFPSRPICSGSVRLRTD